MSAKFPRGGSKPILSHPSITFAIFELRWAKTEHNKTYIEMVSISMGSPLGAEVFTLLYSILIRN